MEKRSLLQKYDIPISHLDFDYIGKCKNTKELERIVTILRSGEEGYYPDLTKCAEDKLKELKPNSRVLRTEERILTKSCLSPQEWEEHSIPLIEWSTDIKNKDTILSTIQENSDKFIDVNLPPIRKGGKLTSKKEKTTDSQPQGSSGSANRVAATNYSDWDKYDADAELLKMDLEEERVKEHVERMNRKNKEKTASMKAIEEKKTNIYEKLTPIEREKLCDDYKILGNECFKSKEYTQALQHYTRCIEVQPTVAAYNNRAITNLKLLRYSDSLSDCNECLRREPANLKALLRKSEACLGLGKKLDAYQAYEQVKVIDPDNAIACRALENLHAELGDVAPSHATRIKIIDEAKDDPPPKTSPKATPAAAAPPPPPPPPPAKPAVDYDLAELVKPNKLVKSKFVKTMESLGKLTPKTGEKSEQPLAKGKKPPKLQDTTPEIKLQIEDPIRKMEDGKCLIEEL